MTSRVRGGKGVVRLAGKVLELDRVRELSAECVEYLAKVARDTREETKHRVSAAKVIVAHHQWREDREQPPAARAFFEMFRSYAEAAAWLSANRERLEMASRQAPLTALEASNARAGQ